MKQSYWDYFFSIWYTKMYETRRRLLQKDGLSFLHLRVPSLPETCLLPPHGAAWRHTQTASLIVASMALLVVSFSDCRLWLPTRPQLSGVSAGYFQLRCTLLYTWTYRRAGALSPRSIGLQHDKLSRARLLSREQPVARQSAHRACRPGSACGTRDRGHVHCYLDATVFQQVTTVYPKTSIPTQRSSTTIFWRFCQCAHPREIGGHTAWP